MLVLDTTVLIDLEHRRPGVVGFLERNADAHLCVPYPVLCEYLVPFDDPEAALLQVEQAFEVEFPTRAHAVAAARLRDAAGRRVAWSDVLIAAHALVGDGTVVTSNVADFEALGVHAVDPRA